MKWGLGVLLLGEIDKGPSSLGINNAVEFIHYTQSLPHSAQVEGMSASRFFHL